VKPDLELARARYKGNLGANLTHFGRALRTAGLPIGSGQIVEATRAVEAVGVENKWDIYWALAACFVRRREELLLFDEVFDLFFRDPFAMSKALGALVSRSSIPDARNRPDPGSRRAREALQKPKPPPPLDPDAPREKRIEYDVTMTASAEHTLRARDFEKMTADEVARAREAIQRMPLPRVTVKTRRLQPDARGAKLDFRRTLASS
jgi:uncharacterized protein with von Willebrand factor type A (vWA) domain